MTRYPQLVKRLQDLRWHDTVLAADAIEVLSAEIEALTAAALAASPAPEGWVLVPVEPTDKMTCAIMDPEDCATPDAAARVWAAMLAAALKEAK